MPGHVVIGSVFASTAGTVVTLTNAAVFSSSSSYICTVAVVTQNGKTVNVNQNSGTQFTVTPGVNDTVNYICIGN